MEFSKDLKPCPFCGSNAYISYYAGDVMAHCAGCGCYMVQSARTMPEDDAKQKIIDKWNKRENTEHRTGKWAGSVCTACGESASFWYDCKFCPHCGAEMEDWL